MYTKERNFRSYNIINFKNHGKIIAEGLRALFLLVGSYGLTTTVIILSWITLPRQLRQRTIFNTRKEWALGFAGDSLLPGTKRAFRLTSRRAFFISSGRLADPLLPVKNPETLKPLAGATTRLVFVAEGSWHFPLPAPPTLVVFAQGPSKRREGFRGLFWPGLL